MVELPLVDGWVKLLESWVSEAIVAVFPHLIQLLLAGRSDGDALLVLDGVGPVGPAVGVDQTLVLNSTDCAVDGVSEVLTGGEHQGEQDQDREGHLESLGYFQHFA